MDGLQYSKDGEASNDHSTRGGIPYFDGTAARFEEWRFRIEARAASIEGKDDEEQQKKELASKVLEGLSGPSLRVAMDLGLPKIITGNGLAALIGAIETSIQGQRTMETKELYREGAKLGGTLSRQSGESMTSYIQRRRRWFAKLTALDRAYTVPEALLTDMLMENSGLSDQQQLMVTNTVRARAALTFENAALELREQHPLIQGKDSRHRDRERGFQRKPWKGQGKGAWRRYPQKLTASMAQEDDWQWQQVREEEDEYFSRPPSYEEQDEDTAYICTSSSLDNELEDVVDIIEQDITVCYLCAGADLDDEEACEEIAQACQDEVCAFFGREGAKDRGVDSGHQVHSWRPKSEMSVQDRKAKVDKAKQNSTCRSCGKKGHWAGDYACPNKS